MVPWYWTFRPAAKAGLFGSLCDAWLTPLADIGANGDDKGKGGKYLPLSPNYKQIARRVTFRSNLKPLMDTLCSAPFRQVLLRKIRSRPSTS